MDHPLVSIALAARDAEATLGLALDSILAQTWPHWELLLYDDGSRDATTEVVRRRRDPRIRLVSDGHHLGLATRLNQAIAAARGPLFARMDADDLACPERLERQVAYLTTHPHIDLLATGAVVMDERLRPLGLFPQSGTHHVEICAHPWRGFHFPHPTWMGRTPWFRRHRYQEISNGAEDQDLLLRTYRHSRFALLPEVLLGYRQGRLNLGKRLGGRRIFAACLWRAFRDAGEPLQGLGAVAGQAALASLDLALIGTGLEGLLDRRRARPQPAATAERWRACLAALGKTI